MTLLDAKDQSAMYGHFIMHKPMSEDEALSWLLVVQACMPEIEDPAWDALERLQLALAGADEPVARTYLAKLVKEGRPDQPLPKAWRPAEVVSAMGRERAITPDDLFTFSEVNLVRLKNRLQQSGVHLSVKWIPRPSLRGHRTL